jgi:hypothetical protein
MFSPTVDAKVRLLKGTIDLALDPTVQFLHLFASGTVVGRTDSNEELLELRSPILVGLNLTSTLTLVGIAGIGYSLATTRLNTSSDAEFASGAGGVLGWFGLGFEARTGRHFALHPEVTVTRVNDDARTWMAVVGLGLNMGAMPDYSDLETLGDLGDLGDFGDRGHP